MKQFEIIKSLYNPIQPSIRQSDKNVSYRECLPALSLQNIIYCYWQLKTSGPLTHQFNYRVVADGCIDVFFDNTNLSESFVMGFCKKHTEFPLENSFDYIGVRFLPSMFSQLFRINAVELSDKFERLELIVPEVAKFLKQGIPPKSDLPDVAIGFDAFFLKRYKSVKFDNDSRFYGAMDLILKNFGTIDTESDLDTGISPRQLRRIFNFYIGTAPKTFCKVVRFQKILGAKPSIQSLKQNKLFYDTGYYDQAHFIKDFKNFYGVTPTNALPDDSNI